jgi:Ser/Thr protein kinase RdoA (MazF antagonist)
MNRIPQKLSHQKNHENSLALDTSDVLEFQKYTQRVWSKVAGRPISEDEADQIIENFGRFLRALASEKKGYKDDKEE